MTIAVHVDNTIENDSDAIIILYKETQVTFLHALETMQYSLSIPEDDIEHQTKQGECNPSNSSNGVYGDQCWAVWV